MAGIGRTLSSPLVSKARRSSRDHVGLSYGTKRWRNIVSCCCSRCSWKDIGVVGQVDGPHTLGDETTETLGHQN